MSLVLKKSILQLFFIVLYKFYCIYVILKGIIVGFNVLNIMNELIVVFIIFGFVIEFEQERNVLVFDFGGGIFDVFIFMIGDGVFEVKFINGDIYLGGRDFDFCSVDYIKKEIKKEYGKDIIIKELVFY